MHKIITPKYTHDIIFFYYQSAPSKAVLITLLLYTKSELTLLYRDGDQVAQKTINNFNYIQDDIDNLTIPKLPSAFSF